VIAKAEPTLEGLGDVLEWEGVERTPAAVSSFRELVMALARITEEEAKIAIAREVEAQLAQLGIQVRLHVASDDDPGGQTATP
jgi:hypothetical protein